MDRNIRPDKTGINTIIISDVHLGSEVSRSSEVKKILNQYNFRRIILLGDIFDELNFARLKKSHWELLSYIRRLSNPKKQIDVIWVEGNHDKGLSDIMSHMMGIKVFKDYSWKVNGRKFLAMHGHQFDRFLNENVLISKIASFIYLKLQEWGKKKQRLAHYLKKKSKGWLRIAEKISNGAVNYGKRRKADVVICGHTHIAEEKNFPKRNITYYNTGCWTDIPSSYITIDFSGVVQIHFVS